MSVVPNTVGRWVKWRTAKRQALDESGTKTMCGYDVPTDGVREVRPPVTWAEHQLRRATGDNSTNWFRDNPKHYCGLCLRICGYE